MNNHKVAFIFPGQGSQYSGMGKYFYDNFKESREVFELSNEILGYSLSNKIFNGTTEEISQTNITQPAILTTSIAILKALQSSVKITPFCTAGLSLGEYSSLVCSGFLNFEQAVPLVRKRAEFMVNAIDGNGYGMTAIIGLDEENVKEVVNESKLFGNVEIANYNCPGQIVISGEIMALEKAEEISKKNGAIKVVRLAVKAPFHTSLLKTAADNLRNELEKIEFNTSHQIPVISNVTAQEIKSNEIVDLLSMQVMSSVLWEKSVKKMIDMGVDLFVEIGPGRSLTGFVKKINRTSTVLNIEDESSFDKVLKFLGGV